MRVNTKDFNNAIKNVSKAVSTDENRIVFTNVHLFTEDNQLVLEACDGSRLHQTKVALLDTDEIQKIDILVKGLKEFKTKDKAINVEVTEDYLKISSKDTDALYHYYKNGSEMQFLNTKEIIPNYDTDLIIRLNNTYLSEVVKNINTSEAKYVDILFDRSKDGCINGIAPVLFKSGNSTNILLPIIRR